jgi:chromatin assembly factor 1 subunit A
MEDPTPIAPAPQKRPREDDVEPPISTPVKPAMNSTASTPLSVLSVRTPSPSPHKSSAPTSTAPNVPCSQTIAAPTGSQPAKRRKLTSQEREAQRLEKEAKAKDREEKKAQKEAEDKIKAEQKAQKDEEKRKKNEERNEKKRLKEEEQQRLEEEKAKKARVGHPLKPGPEYLRTILWSLLVTA